MTDVAGDWPQFRGPERNGRVAWLPDTLPDSPTILWRRPLPSEGHGGIAVADGLVVFGCRDVPDQEDLFLALDAGSGELRWQVSYPAAGTLDYGNSPRAAPLIHDGLVYLQSALGRLTCVDLAAGVELWRRELTTDFGTPPLEWGLTGSPLWHADRLYVQPGGTRGSIAALDPLTGETIWATGIAPPGHASLIVAPHPRGRQLIGYDQHSLGGWDPETGERLWTVIPPEPGDFNVPTPCLLDAGLLVATENNGTRLYPFRQDGSLSSQPVAQQAVLSPDAHSPVVAAGRVFGLHLGLHALDLSDGLRTIWSEEGREFREYGSLLASQTRLLCLTQHGELVLLDSRSEDYRELGRLELGDGRRETLSHPALVGRSLFVRLGDELLCVDLEPPAS
ncbi:MAG: PQQ-binding-like beta-propeller repeat protein [Planctomycetaceae bacterium]